MAKFIIALILSVVAGAILFVLTAMADGMGHSMNAMFTLFPYGTIVLMRYRADGLWLLLTFIQFPVYVLSVMLLKGKRARIAAVVVILGMHIMAAQDGLSSFGRSNLVVKSCSDRALLKECTIPYTQAL